MSYPFLGLLPFFSSWLNTDAASFFASDCVGFLAPDKTFPASVDILLLDCFFVMAVPLFVGLRLAGKIIAGLLPKRG